MKRFGFLFLLAFLLTLGSSAWGQNAYRFDDIAILSQGAYSPVVTTPSVAISVCPSTAAIVGTTCNPLATTFTDSTAAVACVNPNQVTLQGSNVCTGTSDLAGNFGFWVLPGNYIYCITPSPGVVAPGKCQVRTIGSPTGGTLVTSALASDRQPSLLNPNFESPPFVIPPVGWANNTNTLIAGGNLTPGTTLSYETVNPAPGKLQSLKMTTTVQSGQILNNTWWQVYPGDTYSVTGQVRSDGNSLPTLNISFRAKDGSDVADIITTATTNTSWNAVFAAGTVPANADFAIFRVYNASAVQPSTIWFDTVNVPRTSFPGTISSGAFAPSIGDRQPILANPDFTASGQIIPPPGWLLRTNGANLTLSYETVTPAPGKTQSLKITQSNGAGGNVSNAVVFSCTTGDTYSITAMVKTDGVAAAEVDLRDNNASFFATTSTTSTSWTKLTTSGPITSANAAQCQVILGYNTNTAGSIWFDQVSVQKTNFVGPLSITTAPSIVGLTVTSTGIGSITALLVGGPGNNSNTDLAINASPLASSTHKTWFIGTQNNVSDALEFLPSTGAGGLVPAATDAFRIDTSGNGLFNGVMSVGGTADNGVSRLAAGVGAFGNGTAGDASGDWRVGALRVQAGSTSGIEMNGPIVGASMGSGVVLAWTSGVSSGSGQDTSLWRAQANVVGVGSGTANLNGFLNGAGISLGRLNNTGASLQYDTTGTFRFGSLAVLGFTSGAANLAIDTAASRHAAGTWFFGNGTQNDVTGVLGAAKYTDDGAGNFFRLQNVSQSEMMLWNGGTYGWSSTNVASGTRDTGFVRLAADSVGCGTGASGDFSCLFKAAQLIATNIGGGTAAGLFVTAAGATAMDLRDTTQGVDAKNWDFINSGGTLSGRAVNDANNSAVTWLNVTRSGLNPQTVQFLPNISSTRINPRAVSLADATSITPTSDTADENTFSSSQAAGTLTVNAPSGTPVDAQKLVLRLKAANAQTYSFNATYHFSNSVTAPATLAAGKTDYIGLIFNAAASVWDVVAVDQGHTD